MFPRIPLPGLPFGLPTYGLFVALGFLVALWLAERLGRRAGFPPMVVQDTAVWGCIGGLVGAKALLLVVEPPRSFAEVRDVLLFQGGVFYGGFIAAALTIVLVARWRGMRALALCDVLAVPLALGHALGRMGCFFAGCCYGTRCELPWAVHFTHPESLPFQSGIPAVIGLHPVQLYEAAGNAVLAVLALLLFRRRRFDGQVFGAYLAAYGAFRFIVEHWRGDQRGTWGPFSTSQALGLLAVLLGIALLAWASRASRRAGGSADAPNVLEAGVSSESAPVPPDSAARGRAAGPASGGEPSPIP